MRKCAGFMFNGVMIIGSITTLVARGFVEHPVEEYRHQRKHGFLNASFWKS
ncbi:MAG: hypothetical protein H6797_01480 [Candidatus Nomurabacteria bacterium]|nr:MAG: hypothetical protein H6797_01480 [Candidatus Nomurabacteria bacterium]